MRMSHRIMPAIEKSPSPRDRSLRWPAVAESIDMAVRSVERLDRLLDKFSFSPPFRHELRREDEVPLAGI